MSKLKLLELFGGIGACSRALDHLGIDYELVDYVEIDKYACKSFNAIHGTDFKPQDVKEWDKKVEVDLIMHGSPCQDFSIAGKGKGGNEGSGTRSSLMYETVRIVSSLKPKYVLWENVKNLLSEKHRYNFDMYLDKMEELGYRNYYQVLNAKDYGVPQNRERVFTVSIRKDIQEEYKMPEPIPLELRLKDILEDQADEKYYVSDKLLTYFLENSKTQTKKGNNWKFKPQDGNGIGFTVRIKAGARVDDNYVTVKQIGNLTQNANRENPQRGRLYDQSGVSPTLNSMRGGNLQPFIPILLGGIGEMKSNKGTQYFQQDRVYSSESVAMAHPANLPEGSYKYLVYDEQNKNVREEYVETITSDGSTPKHNNRIIEVKEATKKGYQEAQEGDYVNLQFPNSSTRRGRVGKQVANTLLANDAQGVVTEKLLIRRLTPRECWRLMGFDDEAFEKAREVNSDTQLYKQAGNSIVVDVLEAILTNLLINPHKLEKEQMSMFDLIER